MYSIRSQETNPTIQRPVQRPVSPVLASMPLIFLGLVLGGQAVASPPTPADETSASPDADDPLTLAEAALKANPDLVATEAQVAALESRARAVQVWHDPVLALEYSNVPWDSWALGDSPMSGLQIKLQQPLPLPGKNQRREAVVLKDAEARQWELEEKRLQLQGRVRQTYWYLSLTRGLKQVTEKHIALVDSLLQAIRAKYEVGDVGQHDLLRLEVLRDNLKDDLEDFTQRDRALTAAINAALHRTVTMPIVTRDPTSAGLPGFSLVELQALALEQRPVLKQLRSLAEARRVAADLARYERWPDVSVWAGFRARAPAGTDPGTDFFSVGVAVPIPFDFLGRASAKQSEQLELARSVDQTYLAAVDEIDAKLEAAMAAWERAAGKALNYEGKLIPSANFTLEATFAAYRTDRADFASLFQAELQLLEFERTVLVAKTETRIQTVRVETLAGRLPSTDAQ